MLKLEEIADETERADICLFDTSLLSVNSLEIDGNLKDARDNFFEYMYDRRLDQISSEVVRLNSQFFRMISEFIERHKKLFTITHVLDEYREFLSTLSIMKSFRVQDTFHLQERMSRKKATKHFKDRMAEAIGEKKLVFEELCEESYILLKLLKQRIISLDENEEKILEQFDKWIDSSLERFPVETAEGKPTVTDKKLTSYGLFYARYKGRKTVVLSSDTHITRTLRSSLKFSYIGRRDIGAVYFDQLASGNLREIGYSKNMDRVICFFDSRDYLEDLKRSRELSNLTKA